MRVVRNSVTQILDEQFIVAARAKGLKETRILTRHVIRNVLPPFISMVAISLGFMVSGALIVEIVFSLNGMGTLIYDAVVARIILSCRVASWFLRCACWLPTSQQICFMQ